MFAGIVVVAWSVYGLASVAPPVGLGGRPTANPRVSMEIASALKYMPLRLDAEAAGI
jgi:hypothetical protein